MTFTKPDKPARLRGMNGSCSIHTIGSEVDATGAYTPSSETTVANIPCALNQMSAAEALQYGKETDKTMYRLRLPLRSPSGVDIRLGFGQEVTVTTNSFTSGTRMVVVGMGAPQGRSAMQLLTVMEKDV